LEQVLFQAIGSVVEPWKSLDLSFPCMYVCMYVCIYVCMYGWSAFDFFQSDVIMFTNKRFYHKVFAF
jgi:hypothetical protein